MTTQTWMNNGGVWRLAKALWMNDAGTWRQAKQVWANDGGTWRKVFSGFSVLTGQFFSCSLFNTINPQVRFETDGSVSIETAGGALVAGGNWGSPTTTGIGASYWIKVHQDSGAAVSGTLDAWLQLSSFQAYVLTAPTAGNVKTASFSYQIATDGSGTGAVAGGTFTLTSDRS